MFSSVTWNAQLDWLSFQVTRAMLLWVNNHYSDFEGDSVMEGYLETFEKGLEIQVSGRLLFILGEFSTSSVVEASGCFLSNRSSQLGYTCMFSREIEFVKSYRWTLYMCRSQGIRGELPYFSLYDIGSFKE